VGALMCGAVVVAALRSAGAITAERERDTWEPLVLTRLTAQELIDQKFHGILWGCLPLTLAATLPVLGAAVLAGADPALVVVLLLLPANLWFVKRWLIAVGLDWSVRTRGFWKSLLGTVYAGFLIASCANLVGLALGLIAALVTSVLMYRNGPGLVGTWVIPLFLMGGLSLGSLFLEFLSRHFRGSAALALSYDLRERLDHRRYYFRRRR
jgi:hypothetical protein